jgi:hypothetical protein
MVILTEQEWLQFIKIKIKPELLESAIEELKDDLNSKNYLNEKNELVLNKEKTLVKLWEDFNDRFSEQIKDYILRKVETQWLKSGKMFEGNI